MVLLMTLALARLALVGMALMLLVVHLLVMRMLLLVAGDAAGALEEPGLPPALLRMPCTYLTILDGQSPLPSLGAGIRLKIIKMSSLKRA